MILRCVPARAPRGIKIKLILILRCVPPGAQRRINIKIVLILRFAPSRAQRRIKIKIKMNSPPEGSGVEIPHFKFGIVEYRFLGLRSRCAFFLRTLLSLSVFHV